MRTEEFVTLLANNLEPVDRALPGRRFAGGIVLGMLVSTFVMVQTLGLRPDLMEAALLPMFWVKLGFVASLAWAGFLATVRLSHPGRRLDRVPLMIALPVLAMWLLAFSVLYAAEPVERSILVFGDTWMVCPLLVGMLSLPTFMTGMWAMRGYAPTHLPLAGAAVGFFSGGLGALIYSLHCPELAAPFLGLWYLLGILIPTLFGALLGQHLLRW
jgi:hypothetical protein